MLMIAMSDIPRDLIKSPRQEDVLCGRGKKKFQHKGNEQLRLLVGKFVMNYKNAKTKKERAMIVDFVTKSVYEQGGRYLIQDNTSGQWYDGGMKIGKRKCGGAFRDAIRDKVKCMKIICPELQESENNSKRPSLESLFRAPITTHLESATLSLIQSKRQSLRTTKSSRDQDHSPSYFKNLLGNSTPRVAGFNEEKVEGIRQWSIQTNALSSGSGFDGDSIASIYTQLGLKAKPLIEEEKPGIFEPLPLKHRAIDNMCEASGDSTLVDIATEVLELLS